MWSWASVLYTDHLLCSNFWGHNFSCLLFDQINGNAAVKITPQSEVKLKVVGLLKDLSGLSKEMVAQCARLPVYRVTEGVLDLKNMKQANDAVEDADPAQLSTKRKYNIEKWIILGLLDQNPNFVNDH